MAQLYVDPPAEALNPRIYDDEYGGVYSRYGDTDPVKVINDSAESYSVSYSKAAKTTFNAVVLASKIFVDSESNQRHLSAYIRVPRYKGMPDPPKYIPITDDIFHPTDESGHDPISSWDEIARHPRVDNILEEAVAGRLKPKTVIKVTMVDDTVHFIGIVPTPRNLWQDTYNNSHLAKSSQAAIKPPENQTELPQAPKVGEKMSTPSGLEIEIGEPFKHAVDRSASVTNSNGGKPVSIQEIDTVVLTESETYAKKTPDLKSGGREELRRVLDGKKLSVHFSIGTDGTIVQHEDPKTRVTFHSGGKPKTNYGVDGRSVGIEIINRVRRCSGEDSAEVFNGAPVCREIDDENVFQVEFNRYKEYRNPPMQQHEAAYSLLLELQKKYPSIDLMLNVTSERFVWGYDRDMADRPTGLISRGKFLKSYKDGLATHYYCICRARGYLPQESYDLLKDAIRTGAVTTSLPENLNA
jgi:hypothetical protein